jgi:hypothetical protein
MTWFDRRSVVFGFAGVGMMAVAPKILRAEPVYKAVKDLKPGQFVWHPERSPDGPLAIIVSIPEQRVFVYRNGIRIGVSTCSTGAPGHSTPTGVFTILEKDKNHHSSTYNNAPMPNMNRLTWSGVALHAGNLPGYPASHGCIRLPLKFSELLFGVTHVGTPVIVAGSHDEPKEVSHPGLVLSDYAEAEFETVKSGLKVEKLPWQTEGTSGDATTSVIVSHADMTITVLENGKTVASGPATITDPSTPLGRHVFMLIGANDGRQGLTWHAITHHDQTGIPLGQPDETVLQRIKSDESVRQAIAERMHPGMVLITTELPSHPDTRTGEDFVLINTDQSS